MSALDENTRDKIKKILAEHGTPFIDELPDDEYDCCLREMSAVLWDTFVEQTARHIDGTYSNGVVNAVFQQRIRGMENPFNE